MLSEAKQSTTVFAAIELAEGRLITECMPRHRHQEWLKFLQKIDAETPTELDRPLIIDNYATHQHPPVQRWLDRHPRFHLHFIPTSSSWLNLIERWFRKITDKCLRRGTYLHVGALIDTIRALSDEHNANPKSLVWTAQVDEIIEKIAHAREVLNNTLPMN